MPRPLYPNDYIRGAGWRIESGELLIQATRDLAVHGNAAQYIVSPDLFGEVQLDGNTLYELEYGPFYLSNGDGGSNANARDGALARIEFWVDDGVSPRQINTYDFQLRQPDPYWLPVPSVTSYYYADTPQTVKFGVALSHQGGLTIPGGDITNPLPAPANTSVTTETTTGASATEVRDTNLGNYQFTAKPGRKYKVVLENMRVGVETGATGLPLIPLVNIRDGGASTPTTSSPIVA